MSTTDDYKYLFTKALHAKLKEKIFGGIVCKIDEEFDQLYVRIISHDIVWSMSFDHISEKILRGYNAEHAVYEVMSAYKSFILKTFFL